MTDGQPSPRATAVVHLRGDRWIGQCHTPELGLTAVLIGPASQLDLDQACGRWARALRRRGWMPVDQWATNQRRTAASVPLRRLADLLDQQIMLALAAGDRPRLFVVPLRRV